jgi:RNA polymerase sigma-70 factor (ECF subfamily)
VVQDTFVEALGALRTLRDPSAFRGWLLRIAVHKCHRRFRKRKLLRALGLDRGADDVTLEHLAAPALSAEHRAELTRIDAALRLLPERERSAWILRFVHGHELTEVAELSGVSLATVKRLLQRAQVHVARHVSMPQGKGGRRE